MSQNKPSHSPWSYPEGLTVKALKELINKWPEKRLDGTPTMVKLDIRDEGMVVVTELSPDNWQECPITKVASADLAFVIFE